MYLNETNFLQEHLYLEYPYIYNKSVMQTRYRDTRHVLNGNLAFSGLLAEPRSDICALFELQEKICPCHTVLSLMGVYKNQSMQKLVARHCCDYHGCHAARDKLCQISNIKCATGRIYLLYSLKNNVLSDTENFFKQI